MVRRTTTTHDMTAVTVLLYYSPLCYTEAINKVIESHDSGNVCHAEVEEDSEAFSRFVQNVC